MYALLCEGQTAANPMVWIVTWMMDLLQLQAAWDCMVLPDHLSFEESLRVAVYPVLFLAVRN